MRDEGMIQKSLKSSTMLSNVFRNTISVVFLTLLSSVLFSSTNVESQETQADLLDGKYLYESYAECGSCHGADGKGVVEGLTQDPPPPDFTDCSFTTRDLRNDWYAVTKHGGPVHLN